MTTQVDGTIRIVDDPPLIIHLSDEILGEHLPTDRQGVSVIDSR